MSAGTRPTQMETHHANTNRNETHPNHLQPKGMKQKGMKMNARMITNGLLALTVAATGMAAIGCQAPHDEAPAALVAGAPVSAEVADVALSAVPVVSEATGSAEPWRRVSPGTKIMGRVSELTVREGDRVRSGQVLARLESADLEAAVAQARAAVIMAEATLENAAAHHARMEDLHAQRSVTDKNLEDATAGHRVAAANVDVTNANLTAAEVMLSYAIIESPVSGWITSKFIEAGDMASPGRPLFVIDDLSRVKVKINVPESVVVGLRAGQDATVTIDVLGRVTPGTIDRILPTGDPMSRTFDVEMVLDNSEGTIKAGMFARASFAVGTRDAILIPTSAIVDRGQLTGIFVVNDGKAALRWVKLGARVGDSAEVLSGLRVGERFVVAPSADVYDGATIAAR